MDYYHIILFHNRFKKFDIDNYLIIFNNNKKNRLIYFIIYYNYNKFKIKNCSNNINRLDY